MMENIAYLLGAGASRNCLPIVSEMSKMVNEVHGEFEMAHGSSHTFGIVDGGVGAGDK